MLNAILKNLIGSQKEIFLDLLSNVLAIIPLAFIGWFFWTEFGIATKYFAFLPAQYLNIGFLDTFGLFVVLDTLKTIIFPYMNISTDTAQETDEAVEGPKEMPTEKLNER